MISNKSSKWGNLPLLVWAGVPAALCVALIWYPFGFSLGGLIEEWDLIWQMGVHPNFWNSFPGNPMSDMFAARPLQITPFYIARAISPHSFLGFHVVLIGACFLRVLAGIAIGRFLFRGRIFAIVFGLLAFVLPADTQQIVFRTLNISAALAFALCGAASLLTFFENLRALTRWCGIIASMIFYVIAALIYEPIITLYAIVPFALFARYGLHGSIGLVRRRSFELVIWLIAPVASAAYLFYAIVILKSGYQVISSHDAIGRSIIGNLPYLVTSAGFRLFYDGWKSAVDILLHDVAHWKYLCGCAVVLTAAVVFGSDRLNIGADIKRFLRTVFIGVLLIALAYMPFMVSINHMVITQRTMMAPAFGASIVIIAILSALTGRSLLAAAVVCMPIVLIGFVAQVYQLDTYTRDYVSIIRPYMSMIADQSDEKKPLKLVIDRSGNAGYLTGMFVSKVMYGPSDRLGLAGQTAILCKDGPLSQYVLYSDCQLSKGVWTVTDSAGTVTRTRAADVSAISIGDNFDPDYKAKHGVWKDFGSFAPRDSIFKFRQPNADWYECIPDSSWGYDNFCRGDGWTNGILARTGGINYSTYIASVVPEPSFIFDMTPTALEYLLQVTTFGPINGLIAPNLKVIVNGREIPFRMLSNDVLEVLLSKDQLNNGLNKVEFRNAIIKGEGFGLALTHVVLAPLGSERLIGIHSVSSPTAPLGKWIAANGSDGQKILFSGFSTPEATGVWTNGKEAELRFVVPTGAHSLTLNGTPYLSDTHQHVRVDIEINGTKVIEKSFSPPATEYSLVMPVTEGTVARVKLTITEPARPPSADNRELGLYLSRFKVE